MAARGRFAVDGERRQFWATLGKTIVVVGLIVEIIVVVVASKNTRVPERSPDNGSSVAYVNDIAGYRFYYPPTWDITEEGQTTTLKSPKSSTIMAFGIPDQDDMSATSTRLVDLVEAGYDNVRLAESSRELINGNSAAVDSGTGINDTGVRVWWTTIALEADQRVFAITAFSSTGAGKSRDHIDEVLQSFDAT